MFILEGKDTMTPAQSAETAAMNWPEDKPHENGNYQRTCMGCENPFLGHERRIFCRVCATPNSIKAETAALLSALKVAEEALEFEARLAHKQVELYQLRLSEGHNVRPLGTEAWTRLKRTSAALDQIRAATKGMT